MVGFFICTESDVIMMQPITIKQLTFAYPGQAPLFENCNLDLSSDWKLGLLGRNGRGKTTFLNLLQNHYEYQGSITTNLQFSYFPGRICKTDQATWQALNDTYPSVELWQIQRELALLKTNDDILWKPFNTLSGGEQTKVLLATLFAQPGYFILLDEPTNHLDQASRQILAEYLRDKKQGFIITSHDQAFLDQVIDHTLVIERHQLVLSQGNYSDYFREKKQRDQLANSTNQRLKREVSQLHRSQQQRLQWAQRAEHEKNHNSHADKGFIGAKAARMMQKSKNLNRRMDNAIQEKEGLMQEVETVVPLTMNYQPDYHHTLLQMTNVTLTLNDHQMFHPISFEIKAHDQVVLAGNNGIGKSSLFHAILGNFPGKVNGKIELTHGVTVSLVRQKYQNNHGLLKEFAEDNHLSYEDLLNLLRKLGMERKTFTVPIEKMSLGQQKKVELARSLVQPAQLYLWDEPLNYLDTYNQEQIIGLIQEARPPMLIIEHDQHFINQVASHRIDIVK